MQIPIILLKEIQPCFAYIVAAKITAAVNIGHATTVAAMHITRVSISLVHIVAAMTTAPASASHACIAAAPITIRIATHKENEFAKICDWSPL
jgi:hypothetical protein